MKVKFVYPASPPPNGVELRLTIKEALTLRNFLGGANKNSDRDGTLRQILDELSSDDIFGRMIG